MVPRKCHVCCAWTTVVHSGRPQGPPPAHPLWCRESATPAVPGRPSVLCCASLCCAVLCCAVLCCALLSCAELC
eukprot:1314447-Pyramimonas_sp.AAC.1